MSIVWHRWDLWTGRLHWWSSEGHGLKNVGRGRRPPLVDVGVCLLVVHHRPRPHIRLRFLQAWCCWGWWAPCYFEIEEKLAFALCCSRSLAFKHLPCFLFSRFSFLFLLLPSLAHLLIIPLSLSRVIFKEHALLLNEIAALPLKLFLHPSPPLLF